MERQVDIADFKNKNNIHIEVTEVEGKHIYECKIQQKSGLGFLRTDMQPR